jgi:hypothetical protein
MGSLKTEQSIFVAFLAGGHIRSAKRGTTTSEMDNTERDERTADGRLRLAVAAATSGDRDALSYLWARFADEVSAGLDPVSEDDALALTRSAFAPHAIARCRDRADLARCLIDLARELQPRPI